MAAAVQAETNSTNRYKAPDHEKIYLDMKYSLHLLAYIANKKKFPGKGLSLTRVPLPHLTLSHLH